MQETLMGGDRRWLGYAKDAVRCPGTVVSGRAGVYLATLGRGPPIFDRKDDVFDCKFGLR